MTDVVGRGTIELVGDARKLKASIADAGKSIRTLGEGQKDISKAASRSIDQYIGRLQAQNATFGKTTRETELYKLALRGASNEQINAAQASLRLQESQQRQAQLLSSLKSGFIAFSAIAVTSLVAAAAAFDGLVKKAAQFQDLGEKIGDSGESIASFAVAAQVASIAIDQVAAGSVKLTKGLTGVDDETKDAGAAITALGLDLAAFKQLGAADQIETVAKAMAGFEDGTSKTAVAVALFGKAGADMLPFLKELGQEGGRQTILTEEQIRLADEYADKQTKLRAQIGLHAQAIAVEMLPAVNDLLGAFNDLVKGIAGVQDGQRGLKNGTEIQDFAETATTALAGVVDVFDGIVRAARLTTVSLGGLFATVAAIQAREFKLVGSIAVETGRQIDSILNRPSVGMLLEQRRAARKAAGETFRDNFDSDTQGRKKLNFSGAADRDKSAQEQKAKLAFDLEQIRKASEATIGAFANAEKILQARRSANLINDEEYFRAKLGFITLNTREQEAALQKEIDRLQQEKLIGKERIDNQRKIAEVQAKLDKVRADAVAETEVTTIQAAAANAKLAQSYVDAKVAADAYIASITRRNQLELEGIGRGTKFREIQQGRLQIEEKFIQQRQILERDLRNNVITREAFDTYLSTAQDTYQREVALYEQRTAAILKKEEDWVNGATEAMANYIEQSRNVAQQTEELFTNAFKGIEDSIVEFVKTGKLSFKSLADSIVEGLIRIQVRKVLAGVIEGVSGGGGGGGVINLLGGLFGGGRALGGPVSAGTSYVVGERGPELFTPGTSGMITPNGRGPVTVKIDQHFHGPQDSRSVSQAAVETGQRVNRELARNT